MLRLEILQSAVAFLERVYASVSIDARPLDNLLDLLLLVGLDLGEPLIYLHELVHNALVLVPGVSFVKEIACLEGEVRRLNCVDLLIDVLLQVLDSLIQSGLDKVKVTLPSSIGIISVFHLLLNYEHVDRGVFFFSLVEDDSCVVTHNL